MGDSSRVIEENALMAKLSARVQLVATLVAALQLSRLACASQPMNLTVRDIKADGHCLYRSLEDQLALEHGAWLRRHVSMARRG